MCSRAARSPNEHRHDSQCAHDLMPHSAQPRRSSNSANNSSQRHVAAAMCPASSQISRSRSSSDVAPGCRLALAPIDTNTCSIDYAAPRTESGASHRRHVQLEGADSVPRDRGPRSPRYRGTVDRGGVPRGRRPRWCSAGPLASLVFRGIMGCAGCSAEPATALALRGTVDRGDVPRDRGPAGVPRNRWPRWCSAEPLAPLVFRGTAGPAGVPWDRWPRWCSVDHRWRGCSAEPSAALARLAASANAARATPARRVPRRRARASAAAPRSSSGWPRGSSR